MTRDRLAKSIFKAAHLRGDFLLRAGTRSNEYFDKYRFESDPRLLCEIAKQLVPLIPPDIDYLAGLELGGVPVATALSLQTGIPAVFVRKSAKAYGPCKFAEGAEIDGKHLLIVEDIVSSGGQIALSAKDLRAAGATIKAALCVINRSGKETPLAEHRLELRALFTMEELKRHEQ